MYINAYTHPDLRHIPADKGWVFSNQTNSGFAELTCADIHALKNRFPILLDPHSALTLPVVPLEADIESEPLDGYVPCKWEQYPFEIADTQVQTDNPSDSLDDAGSTLWVDTTSRQFNQFSGYRLFTDNGEPTRYLQRKIEVAQTVRHQIADIRELVGLIHQANLLSSITLLHQGRLYVMARIDPRALSSHSNWLEDQPGGLRALLLADYLLESQSHLTEYDGIWVNSDSG
ncbi:hypothetical protein CFI10_16975 [Marinobacterium iners]|uniref:SapC family protein n=1 Tax=Marinobacterium iners TaxID=48076 RepID=UPI001A8FEB92|nr:SapC family protein [Marinobacterium iners]QSR36644.1 hypothetical protein CFI10_16975 [Marinobacterium iners]